MCENLQKIGKIQGDSKRLCHRQSKKIIESGEWKGEGLLGKVITKIQKLEKSAIEYGFCEADYWRLKQARSELFQVLEDIQHLAETDDSNLEK